MFIVPVPVLGTSLMVARGVHAVVHVVCIPFASRSTSICYGACSTVSFPPTMVAYDAVAASWTVGDAGSFLDGLQKTCAICPTVNPWVDASTTPRSCVGSVSMPQLADLLDL